MRKKNKIILISSILLFIILFIFLFYQNIQNLFVFKGQNIPESEDKIVENCKNLNLFKTSKCLVSDVKTFYKFNESQQDEVDSNFSDLLINGGVCNDWAKLYERLGNKLNFVSFTIPLDIDDDGKNDHRIAILSDKEDYCILEQTTYWCKDLK